jgi:hypothetical protein
MPGTERGLYSLAVTPDANGLSAGFTATATVIASGRQHDDLDCWAFSINERGERSAQSQSGATSAAITERCWR